MGEILKFLLALFLILLILPFIIGLGWLVWQLFALIFGGVCIGIAWESVFGFLFVIALIGFIIWCFAS